jgi:hypothetical protein
MFWASVRPASRRASEGGASQGFVPMQDVINAKATVRADIAAQKPHGYSNPALEAEVGL